MIEGRGPEQNENEQLSGTLAGTIRSVFKGLGAVSSSIGLAGVAALVLGIVLFLFVADLRTFSYVILGVSALLLLAFMIISWDTVSRAITGRQGRYGANTAVMVLAFGGILALVNFITMNNVARIDVTAVKQFSLAPRTVNLLKELPEPVEAIGFFDPTDPQQMVVRNQVDDLLHEFQRRSDRFTYRYVDPDLDRVTAQYYQVTQYQTSVFEGKESGRRHSIVAPAQEQDLVTALLIATGVDQKRVYFLTGHDERSILDVQDRSSGFGFAAGGLMSDNYRVTELNLLQVESVPQDTAVLVVAGPKRDLQEGETAKLDQYLKRGGNMVFLLDPETPPTFRQFLERWGLKIPEGQIIDLASAIAGDPKTVVVPRFRYPPQVTQGGQVTVGLSDTYYAGVPSIQPAKNPQEMPTVALYQLAITSANSFLVKDPNQTQPAEGDPQGPFVIAAAAEAIGPVDEPLPADPAQAPRAKIVVFGDSDFASNLWFFNSTNSDFFLNAVNWSAGDVNLIDIRPKPRIFREWVVTRTEMDFVRYSSWFLLPLAMAALGGVAWWRRR